MNTKIHRIYTRENGEIVPGVSEVLDYLGTQTEHLMTWAVNSVKRGIDPFIYRTAAALKGNAAHEMISCEINAEKFNPFQYTIEQQTFGKKALARFKEWAELEVQGYSFSERGFVSEIHEFGGTIDALIKLKNGKMLMCDFKTGRSIYLRHWVQLGAYSILLKEQPEYCDQFEENGDAAIIQITDKYGPVVHTISNEVLILLEDVFLNVKKVKESLVTLKRGGGLE